MKQRLLGDGLMGMGDKSRHIGPPYYLLNDTFTTNRSAGAVNGTVAEPGPGLRTVVDTNIKLSISSGALSLATGGVAAGNPGIWYGPLVRSPGLVCVSQFSHSAQGPHIGFDNGVGGQISDGIRPNGTTLTVTLNNSSAITVGAVATSTTYRVAVALRSAGSYLFIKGGTFTNWTLLFANTLGTYTPNPGITVVSTGSVATVDYYRVPSVLWLPAPLASDSFATWGSTDGAGHGETTGIGSGGGGLSWTSNVGTFTAASGTANASALSGGLAIATVDTSKADVVMTVRFTRSAGIGGVIARYVDSGNYVYAAHDGTNALLVKVVAGTQTTLINTAATYVANAEIRLICEGTAFRLFYNALAVGTVQTIADAGLQSGTKQGLYTSDTGNTFDDLRVFSRGTGGEYSALDSF